jgi:hypothetical protein
MSAGCTVSLGHGSLRCQANHTHVLDPNTSVDDSLSCTRQYLLPKLQAPRSLFGSYVMSASSSREVSMNITTIAQEWRCLQKP